MILLRFLPRCPSRWRFWLHQWCHISALGAPPHFTLKRFGELRIFSTAISVLAQPSPNFPHSLFKLTTLPIGLAAIDSIVERMNLWQQRMR